MYLYIFISNVPSVEALTPALDVHRSIWFNDESKLYSVLQRDVCFD